MANTPQPKPWISEIHAYVPGKSAGADGKPLIKLSANENPLGTSAAALAARAAAPSPAQQVGGGADGHPAGQGGVLLARAEAHAKKSQTIPWPGHPMVAPSQRASANERAGGGTRKR